MPFKLLKRIGLLHDGNLFRPRTLDLRLRVLLKSVARLAAEVRLGHFLLVGDEGVLELTSSALVDH